MSAADNSVAARSAKLLKQEFRFSPPVESIMEPVEEVVEMEAFTVVESMQRRDLERTVQEQERRIREERYSIARGGTLLNRDVGKARIELGTWSGGAGIQFLKISW